MPGGRPKGSGTEAAKLKQALLRYETKHGTRFYDTVMEKAFNDPVIMKVVLDKLVPTLKQVEMDAQVDTNVGVITIPAKLPPCAPVPEIDGNSAREKP